LPTKSNDDGSIAVNALPTTVPGVFTVLDIGLITELTGPVTTAAISAASSAAAFSFSVALMTDK
jgi:hypothetical protein